jgi:hypothetical protein
VNRDIIILPLPLCANVGKTHLVYTVKSAAVNSIYILKKINSNNNNNNNNNNSNKQKKGRKKTETRKNWPEHIIMCFEYIVTLNTLDRFPKHGRN